jgi:hypothetical protein
LRACSVVLRLGLQEGHLGGAQFAAVQAGQHLAGLDLLAEHGIEIGHAASHAGADARDALFVEVDTARHAQHLAERGNRRHLERALEVLATLAPGRGHRNSRPATASSRRRLQRKAGIGDA